MPAIYPDSSVVPILNGEARGGVTVVMDQPDQIDGLLAVCELAPRPPETPLLSVYKALTDPGLDLDEWRDYWRSTRGNSESKYSQQTGVIEPHLKSDITMLKDALQVAHDLWQSQPEDEKRQLSCVAVIGEHKTTASRKLEITGDKTVFALYHGSIIASVVRLPLYPRGPRNAPIR
jgi:hypothetical protein